MTKKPLPNSDEKPKLTDEQLDKVFNPDKDKKDKKTTLAGQDHGWGETPPPV